MESLIAIIAFVFGTLIGSFLNVVILRHNTGQTIRGRSGCAACGKTLEWYELVPVISYAIQRGRCRRCRARVSLQYPLVELATGALFLLVILKEWSLAETLIALLVVSLLMVVFVYDLRHMIIPDTFVWMIVGVGAIALFIDPSGGIALPGMWKALAGPLLALPFALIWLVSRGMWMGLGDAKLTLGLGILLGIEKGFVMLLYSFWIGALVSVVLLLVQRVQLSSEEKRFTMKSEVPFGPFLVLAFWFVYLFPQTALAPFMYLQL